MIKGCAVLLNECEFQFWDYLLYVGVASAPHEQKLWNSQWRWNRSLWNWSKTKLQYHKPHGYMGPTVKTLFFNWRSLTASARFLANPRAHLSALCAPSASFHHEHLRCWFLGERELITTLHSILWFIGICYGVSSSSLYSFLIRSQQGKLFKWGACRS